MFKIVVLGDGGIGKTSLLSVIRQNVIDLKTVQMTIGVQFHVIQIEYNNEDKITFQTWDFGGQEQFKNMGVFSKFCLGANGAIFCFDLSDYETLLNIPEWYEIANSCHNENVIKILIGTKSDLIEDTDELLIQEYIKKYNFREYIKTSSLDKTNIELVFKKLADFLYSP